MYSTTLTIINIYINHTCVDVLKCTVIVCIFHFPVPGPVSGLLCKKNSSESVHISWSVPREPNGDIRGYNVSYREIEGNASEEFKVGPEYIHKVIKSLSKFYSLYLYNMYHALHNKSCTVYIGVNKLTLFGC